MSRAVAMLGLAAVLAGAMVVRAQDARREIQPSPAFYQRHGAAPQAAPLPVPAAPAAARPLPPPAVSPSPLPSHPGSPAQAQPLSRHPTSTPSALPPHPRTPAQGQALPRHPTAAPVYRPVTPAPRQPVVQPVPAPRPIQPQPLPVAQPAPRPVAPPPPPAVRPVVLPATAAPQAVPVVAPIVQPATWSEPQVSFPAPPPAPMPAQQPVYYEQPSPAYPARQPAQVLPPPPAPYPAQSPVYHDPQPTRMRLAVEPEPETGTAVTVRSGGWRWPGLALGPKFGTTGVGGDLTLGVSRYLNLRSGVNYARFSFGDSDGDVEYKMEHIGVPLFLDIYPGGGSFRLVAGAYFHPKTKWEMVTTPTGRVRIGDNVYTADQAGTLTGAVEPSNVISPYLGIGFGNAVGENHRMSFSLDLGVMFNTYDVSLVSDGTSSGDATFQEDLETLRKSIKKDADYFQIYPVLTLGFAIRF